MSIFTIRPYRLDDVGGLYDAADESREHIAKWMDWMTPGYSKEVRRTKVADAGGVILKRMTMDYRWKGQRFCLVKDPSGAPMMLCEAQP